MQKTPKPAEADTFDWLVDNERKRRRFDRIQEAADFADLREFYGQIKTTVPDRTAAAILAVGLLLADALRDLKREGKV